MISMFTNAEIKAFCKKHYVFLMHYFYNHNLAFKKAVDARKLSISSLAGISTDTEEQLKQELADRYLSRAQK